MGFAHETHVFQGNYRVADKRYRGRFRRNLPVFDHSPLSIVLVSPTVAAIGLPSESWTATYRQKTGVMADKREAALVKRPSLLRNRAVVWEGTGAVSYNGDLKCPPPAHRPHNRTHELRSKLTVWEAWEGLSLSPSEKLSESEMSGPSQSSHHVTANASFQGFRAS